MIASENQHIKERLILFIKHKNLNIGRFEKILKLANGYISSVKSMGSDKIALISEAFPDLNLTWLITGKGEMLNAESSDFSHRYYPSSEEILNTVAAPDTEYKKVDYKDKYILELERKIELMALIIKDKEEIIESLKSGKIAYLKNKE